MDINLIYKNCDEGPREVISVILSVSTDEELRGILRDMAVRALIERTVVLAGNGVPEVNWSAKEIDAGAITLAQLREDISYRPLASNIKTMRQTMWELATRQSQFISS